MNEPIEVLESYASAFREVINERVWQRSESPKTLLRLNDEVDWSFICVAMDVVGDASLAIGHFLRFSLDGPTRYDEVGERYLRLYGILSAAYVQQEAVLKLYKLMNCPNPKAVQAAFSALEIRTVRHQLASHSLDFLPARGLRTQAFVPVRIGLSGYTCVITENRGDRSRTVDLKEAINRHCLALISVIDRIYEKSLKTLYRDQQKKLAEFQKRLADLRFILDGNRIVHVGTGKAKTELRVAFVPPDSSNNRN
ncbi:MAG: hypothetical protein JSR29_05015 [Nitrospira sp.]|nr:hypothetical protein [Nitrospira sp.]